jgi:hypothetical protein
VFGVIAWELATGKHPFGNHPNSQMARLHDLTVGNEVNLPGPLTTPGLDTVVRRCLRRLQKDRYDTADALLHDLRKLQTHDGVVHVVALPAPQDLWWWQFHQRAMAVLVSATPVLSWLVREWVGRPAGTWAFLLVLAMATASVTLRLNLSLTLRIHPSTLAPHRQRLFPWIAIAEALIAVTIVGSATVIAGQHEATAALLISLAIVIAASLAVIEPATTRNAGLTGTA